MAHCKHGSHLTLFPQYLCCCVASEHSEWRRCQPHVPRSVPLHSAPCVIHKYLMRNEGKVVLSTLVVFHVNTQLPDPN
jgi:hypothetical protein